MKKGPKILLLDIETAPNKVYTWGLFKQNIALSQIEEPGYTMCWAAKWLGEKKVYFNSLHEDAELMLEEVYILLDEADIVIHYNGTSFDIPTLNREFLEAGWKPPAPFVEIDLYRTVRSRFRFLSNKMEYIAQRLLGEGKTNHKGMDMWRDCMAGDPAAWRTMKKYNKQDVVLLEKLYPMLRPWIQPHPNLALWNDDEKTQCPKCGSENLYKHPKIHTTQTMRYQRLKCRDCGTWTRERTNNLTPEKKKAILVGVK